LLTLGFLRCLHNRREQVLDLGEIALIRPARLKLPEAHLIGFSDTPINNRFLTWVNAPPHGGGRGGVIGR